jgi:hypothetical protein
LLAEVRRLRAERDEAHSLLATAHKIIAFAEQSNCEMTAERDAMRAVVDAARDLVRSGYDGPFAGERVEPLFAAVAKMDEVTRGDD